MLVCLLVLIGCGCLRLQQEISIDGKNQGRFKMQISVPQRSYEQFIATSSAGFKRFFDPDKGAAYFPMDQGFRVDNYRVFTHEKRQYIQIEGQLTDLTAAFQSGKLGAFTLTEAAGQTRLRMDWKDKPQAGAPAIHQAMDGLRLFLKIDVPGKIISTTAHTTGRRSVSWTFNTDQDAEFLSVPPAIEVTYEP